MYQNCCKKCGSTSLFVKEKSGQKVLYCEDCGAWIKNLGADEYRAFLNSKKSTEQQLYELLDKINADIDREMAKEPLSAVDSVRKNAYCYGLERCRYEIERILGYD